MTGTEDWATLGREIKARRTLLRLPQDLVDQGGPSEFTIRKLERGESDAIRGKTKKQLEYALQWPDGLVDKILAGTATRSEMDEVVARDEAAGFARIQSGLDALRAIGEPAARASAALGGGVRHVGNLTPQERAEQLQRLGRTPAEVHKPRSRRDEEDAIFELANQLIPMLARRSPSSPASRAAVTNLLDVMREVAEGMLSPEDTGDDS